MDYNNFCTHENINECLLQNKLFMSFGLSFSNWHNMRPELMTSESCDCLLHVWRGLQQSLIDDVVQARFYVKTDGNCPKPRPCSQM